MGFRHARARSGLAASLALLAGGCGGSHHVKSAAALPADWRAVATPADRGRLRRWRDGWVAALASANQGDAAKVSAAGALLQPDAALGGVAPPPGDYRCRVTKLGSKTPGGPAFLAYPPFTCRIAREGDVLSFTKVDGSQRPVGLLFPSDEARMVFLGTLVLGDERSALRYGRDPERDMVGALERIGERRWRLVLPWPHWESMLDVIELVPA